MSSVSTAFSFAWFSCAHERQGLAGERPAGVLDAVADRAAQVVGQGGTRPGGVGTIGDLACSHGIIEADLRVFGKVHSGGAIGRNRTNRTAGCG